MSTESLARVPFKIPREVARELGYYVYVYVDPRSEAPFYVGKGLGQRALAHLSAEVESRKGRFWPNLPLLGVTRGLTFLRTISQTPIQPTESKRQ